MEQTDRSRRAQVIAVLVALALLGSAGYLLVTSNHGSTQTTSSSSMATTAAEPMPIPAPPPTSSSSQTSTETAGGQVDITDMFGDVVTSGEQLPNTNSSTVDDKSTYSGPAGSTFNVLFDALYQGCASTCPSQITQVSVETPGFTVVETVPTLPVPFQGNGAGPMNMEATFTVELMAPQTPYTGTLTLVADAE